MDVERTLIGKRVLIVDDEKDVLEVLTELLLLCKVDPASSFEKAKHLIETNYYDIVVLDIMGVDGFELLKIANEKGIPALMLTAHAVSEQDLIHSARNGAAYYVPKDEIDKIPLFIADVIDAKEKQKNPWIRWYQRLGSYFDTIFVGPNWREREKEFWRNRLRGD